MAGAIRILVPISRMRTAAAATRPQADPCQTLCTNRGQASRIPGQRGEEAQRDHFTLVGGQLPQQRLEPRGLFGVQNRPLRIPSGFHRMGRQRFYGDCDPAALVVSQGMVGDAEEPRPKRASLAVALQARKRFAECRGCQVFSIRRMTCLVIEVAVH